MRFCPLGDLWVYVRGDPEPRLTVYNFSPDRAKRRLLDFIGDYQGYIHADAFSEYDELFAKEGVVEEGYRARAREEI